MGVCIVLLTRYIQLRTCVNVLAVRMCVEDSVPEVLLASLDADKYPSQLLLAAG